MAWASNWIMALGLYAGRQPRREYGRFDLVDDLPKIFIPNELTGNEIVRAIKTTGKQQMLTENNMVRLTINILALFCQSCCIIFLQPPCDVHLFIECIVGLLNILGSIRPESTEWSLGQNVSGSFEHPSHTTFHDMSALKVAILA